MVDPGKYNKDQKLFTKLVNNLYADYPDGVTLPPDYAYYIEHDMQTMLIRLSRYKFIAKMLTKTDTLLDVGCGPGLGDIFLSQYCKHVTGIDVKSTEIDQALKLNRRTNVEFIKQDLYKYRHQPFSVVTSFDVIEHLDAKNGEKMIAKMAKLTDKTGMISVGTPSIYSYPYQGKLSQASHVKCYDSEELKSLIGKYFQRVLCFSMNDEVVHTGNPKMAWYYFVLGFYPKR
jgi:2-polyprenyl-3-methyl-5-hydroxy-6-metoxy-1,4-benzoquinol methylase